MNNFGLGEVHFVFSSMGLAPSVRITANKNLLAEASPVFDELFKRSANEIHINNASPTAFKELLQFIRYPRINTLTIENVEEVVRLADDYGLVKKFDSMLEFFQKNLSVPNVMIAYHMAIFLRKDRLENLCEKYIQIYTDEILRSTTFLRCNRRIIGRILGLDILQCDEIELFNAYVKWAQALCRKTGLDADNSEHVKH